MKEEQEHRILVTGAFGQLGSELVPYLQEVYGSHCVVATDLRVPETFTGISEIVDVLDKDILQEVIDRYQITCVYHLAAVLSAKGEEQPMMTWDLNMKSWLYVLDISTQSNVRQVFYPSSIAVYGSRSGENATASTAYPDPTTVYGISKLSGEYWAQYYYKRYGLDVRSLRYPGIVSYRTPPGGGTTDYAIAMYQSAAEGTEYTCFLKANSRLPMMYIDDAIRATVELMRVPTENINNRTSYALGGISFTPWELQQRILTYVPDFRVNYVPDNRQAIADTWPGTIDDREARKDWGWKPQVNLDRMTQIMLENLKIVALPQGLGI